MPEELFLWSKGLIHTGCYGRGGGDHRLSGVILCVMKECDIKGSCTKGWDIKFMPWFVAHYGGIEMVSVWMLYTRPCAAWVLRALGWGMQPCTTKCFVLRTMILSRLTWFENNEFLKVNQY